MLHLYNTLNRRKELFEPLVPGKVGMYVCGITVYDDCHVGHGRAMIVYDILYRHLLASGFTVKYVRNITDVDDKIINRAAELGTTPTELAQRFIDEMHSDERALGVLPPTFEPRATETIDGMISLIKQLIDGGYAYVGANGDVFYRVKAFDGYGKLSGKKPDELRAGERVAVDTNKHDPLDFVLWKSAKPSEPHWDSPWGPGRPGWHIECSAMARELLGEEFDLHGGGQDLEFPHHENEIAQSEAVTGGRFARYWMHNGLVRIGDEKMSKSLNNFSTIKDVLASYTGEEIRLFIISSHYRSPLIYQSEALDAARTTLRRFYTALRGRGTDASLAERSEGNWADIYVQRFESAMNDDLNTPEALSVLHELTTELNREAADSDRSMQLAGALVVLGGRLGLLQHNPETVLQASAESGAMSVSQIEALIQERQLAREAKDFSRSDEIRDALAAEGVVLEDADGKTSWRRS